MIKQNHPKLPQNVRKSGCRYRCLQAIAEWVTRRELSVQDITEAYHVFSKQPTVMNAQCNCGSDEHKIIWDAFARLGCDDKAVQVGTMQNGKPTGWQNEKVDYDFMILDYKTPTGKHFVLADCEGKTLWDPWDYSQEPLSKLQLQRQLLYKVNYTKGVRL